MGLLSLIGGAAAAAQGVQGIIDIGRSIVGGFGGSTPIGVAAVGGPGFPGAGPVQQGTSVGPTTNPIFGDPVSANLGGVVPAVVRALPRILPAAAAVGAVEVGSRMLIPGPATGQFLHPHKIPTTRRGIILANARAFNPGATSKKIIRSARQCGLELAAATFGLTVLDVCFLIAQPPTRRARGISAADLRRTRATVRKVHNIEADFREWCKPGPVRRRRK